MIKPTIGRKVWFFTGQNSSDNREQDATIIDVHGDRCVSLYVVNRGGTAGAARSVVLVQEGYTVPKVGSYCTWMPYQSGQAKKSVESAVEAVSDTSVEAEIKAKGLTAARVTPERIEQVIASETYYVFPGTTVTIACLSLRNGFRVIGESACASPENFDEAIGRKIARENAKQKIWALEGYALLNRLAGFAPLVPPSQT